MLHDVATLGYLEWRKTVNRIKIVLRSPGRLLFYLIVIAYFVGMGSLRDARHVPAVKFAEPFASAAFFGFVTLLGVVAYGAASGFTGAFASAAEARFIINSHLDERVVVLWLQARRIWLVCVRMIVSIAFYLFVVGRSAGAVGFGLTVIGGAAAAAAVAVPALKLRRAVGLRVSTSVAGAVAAIGILPMLAALSATLNVNPTALAVERFHAGTFVNACLMGNSAALAALWSVTAAFLVAAWMSGHDLYPELYASSLRALDFRQRARRSRRGSARYQSTSRGSAYHALSLLSGSWTIAWKEWIGFVRSPGARRIFLFTLIGCSAGGYALASFALRSPDPMATSRDFIPGLYFGFLVFVAMGSAMNLGADIGKPLWWIGPDSLTQRLLAWICSRSWRMIACVSACLLFWVVGLRRADLVVYAVPLAIVLVLHLSAVGLVLYALFPSTLDQRGPMGLVRVLVTYVLAAPPLIASIVAYILLHGALTALTSGIVLAFAEIYGLIAFAAWRITGAGSAFAQAESM